MPTVESRASRTVARSDSLRTTVPPEVAFLLELRDGDKIAWTWDAGQNRVTVSRRDGAQARRA